MKDVPCDCSRVTRKLFDWDGLESSVVHTHKSCVCNEVVALVGRHQMDDGMRFDNKYKLELWRQMKPAIRQCKPISKMAVAMGYSGPKRKLALRAIESLKHERLNEEDANVRMFLKDDKYSDDEVKAPRCIQYRDKRYAITLAQYMYPIEHALYKQKHNGHYQYAKGRNLRQRAADLQGMWDSMEDPVAWLLDHSKFDAHFNATLVKLAARCNSKYYKEYGDEGFVYWLLMQQLHNKGRTKNGTKYRTYATRMSGDQNTGKDNSSVNLAMIELVLKWCGIEDYQIYVDGDDSVVVINKRDMHKCNVELFKRFGMKTTEDWAEIFEKVEFCQCRPVWTPEGYVMVRNPYRVLKRVNWTVKKFPKHLDGNYLKAVMACESALNEGIPVMGPLSVRSYNSIHCKNRKKRIETDLDYQVKALGKSLDFLYEAEIHPDTRASFEEAWEIDYHEQIRLENMRMVMPCDPYVDALDNFPVLAGHVVSNIV